MCLELRSAKWPQTFSKGFVDSIFRAWDLGPQGYSERGSSGSTGQGSTSHSP